MLCETVIKLLSHQSAPVLSSQTELGLLGLLPLYHVCSPHGLGNKVLPFSGVMETEFIPLAIDLGKKS